MVHHPERFIVGKLMQWMFAEIGRWRFQNASLSTAQGQFCAPDGIDRHSG
jgi:hypothetical protein